MYSLLSQKEKPVKYLTPYSSLFSRLCKASSPSYAPSPFPLPYPSPRPPVRPLTYRAPSLLQAQLILPIAGTALCYYVYLFTTHPTYVSSLSSPSCDGAVPYNWDKLPSSYAEDSNASSSDSENDESSEAGAGQRLLRGRRGSAFPTTEVGKSRRERTGRSWSYVDYQRARSSKEGSQASGSERKGREKRGRGSVTTAGEGASGRV